MERINVYWHVMRREEHYVGRMAMEMKVQGRIKRGRPKRRWLDKVEDDIKEKGMSAGDVFDRATLEAYVIVHRPHIKVGIRRRKIHPKRVFVSITIR